MTDDTKAATGGMRGGTGDTPEHAGAPEETGSVNRVPASGGEPEPAETGTTPDHPDETGESPDAGTADLEAWTSETERRAPSPATGEE